MLGLMTPFVHLLSLLSRIFELTCQQSPISTFHSFIATNYFPNYSTAHKQLTAVNYKTKGIPTIWSSIQAALWLATILTFRPS